MDLSVLTDREIANLIFRFDHNKESLRDWKLKFQKAFNISEHKMHRIYYGVGKTGFEPVERQTFEMLISGQIPLKFYIKSERLRREAEYARRFK